VHAGRDHRASGSHRHPDRGDERGRRRASNLVGKPAALLLLRRNATVTVCHRRPVTSRGIRETQTSWWQPPQGKPHHQDMVKPGASSST